MLHVKEKRKQSKLYKYLIVNNTLFYRKGDRY